MDTTELVHEAYLKLAKRDPRWQNRRHFFATAAKVMRHLLVDAARASGSRKRGGDAVHVSLEADDLVLEAEAERILAIDRVLKELAQRLPRLSQVVELRFFGGLTEEEAAEVLEISTRTLRRDWIKARAWLNRRLGTDGPG
ncbi:MAG: ECF-type sigma factor [Acidobacteriota bacterium]